MLLLWFKGLDPVGGLSHPPAELQCVCVSLLGRVCVSNTRADLFRLPPGFVFCFIPVNSSLFMYAVSCLQHCESSVSIKRPAIICLTYFMKTALSPQEAALVKRVY